MSSEEVEGFLLRCEPALVEIEWAAKRTEWAETVEEQLRTTRDMIAAHRKILDLLPAPDEVATAHLSRGIALSIEGMEAVRAASRTAKGRPRWADRRRIDRLLSAGEAEVNKGWDRLRSLAGR